LMIRGLRMVNIVRSLLGLDEGDGKEIVKAAKKIKKKEKKAKVTKEPVVIDAKGRKPAPRSVKPDPKPDEPKEVEPDAE